MPDYWWLWALQFVNLGVVYVEVTRVFARRAYRRAEQEQYDAGLRRAIRDWSAAMDDLNQRRKQL